MSKSHDSRTKFKIDPEHLNRLKALQSRQLVKPSLAALCNVCMGIGIEILEPSKSKPKLTPMRSINVK